MSIENEIDRLIQIYGTEGFERATQRALSTARSGEICTIVANQGVHSFPKHILRGTVYNFSHGNFNLDDPDSFKGEMTDKLSELARFLSTKKWSDVYLVISGHAVLSMSIKLLVYRITRIETNDWIYNGDRGYFSFQVKMRDIILKAGTLGSGAD